MATINIDATDFESTITDNDIVLVDFWADWCGPCKRFAPVYEKVSEDNKEIVFAKLDTDANQRTAIRFNVRSIPSILFFVNGKHVDTVVGGHPSSIKNVLTGKIQQHSGETVKK